MKFLVRFKDNDGSNVYHITNPEKGLWTGWHYSIDKAKEATMRSDSNIRDIPTFLSAKKQYHQTIIEVVSDNTIMPFDEFIKNYPEYFI